MPSWFKSSSSKRSCVDTDKHTPPSSTKTQAPSSWPQKSSPYSSQQSHNTAPSHPKSSQQPNYTHSTTRHRDVSPMRKDSRPSTSTGYPKYKYNDHRSPSGFRHVHEVPQMGYDGYHGSSDTTVEFKGKGVGRQNAVRGRSVERGNRNGVSERSVKPRPRQGASFTRG
ncbi:hypothetical protein IQ06DRAFT_308540 [Phaeosphaeriaceae sp. SRC1lsM3a]|nr:hypothetical protein IQ06DRAFT_308540 [Stagonospora sp. SRC1lsM3a]